jgi:imidazolonepropionase-like amidohydrolase
LPRFKLPLSPNPISPVPRNTSKAIVDEAHRLGLKVACHTYGGEGMASCINAGVDAPNHLLELDQDGIKVMLQKRLPFEATLDDLIALEKGDLEATGGRNSRMKLAEQAVRRAVAAGVPIVFGSGATSAAIPHGKQANQFAYYAKWELTPTQALQTAYLNAAHMLNYGIEKDTGRSRKASSPTSPRFREIRLRMSPKWTACIL